MPTTPTGTFLLTPSDTVMVWSLVFLRCGGTSEALGLQLECSLGHQPVVLAVPRNLLHHVYGSGLEWPDRRASETREGQRLAGALGSRHALEASSVTRAQTHGGRGSLASSLFLQWMALLTRYDPRATDIHSRLSGPQADTSVDLRGPAAH